MRMMPRGQEEGARPEPAVRPEETATRIFLRPIGSPMPLGFLGLAVATLVMAGLDLGWVPTAESHQVALVLVAFAFPLQIIAAVLGFLGRDTVVGSGIGVQGASWLTIGLVLLTSAPGQRSQTLALFLFVAAAALIPPAFTASTAKLVPALVMVGTSLRFVFTGLYERFGTSTWKHVTGWEGVALCCLALYASLALEVEGSKRRTVLPLGRHGSGRRAISGGLRDQIRHVEDQAGVREQL